MATISQSWLRPGDEIKYWGEESPRRALRIALLGGVPIGLLKAGLEVWAYGYTNTPSLILDGAGGFLVGVVLLFFLNFHRKECVLTSDRLLYRQGLVRQILGSMDEVPITDISTIAGGNSDDGPLVLMLNGGQSLQISNLPNLDQLRDALEEAIGAT